MTETTEAIVDRTRFAQAKAALGVNFARILGYFREDGEKSIAQIEDAMRRENAAALVRPAHTLKGESLQFGAEPLGLMAEAIEKAARDAVERHDFPYHVAAQVALLRPAFAKALAYFDAELAVPAPPRRVVGFGRKQAV